MFCVRHPDHEWVTFHNFAEVKSTTLRQNLQSVETHLRPAEAVPETECNRLKSDNFLFIKFSKKITFSQPELHTIGAEYFQGYGSPFFLRPCQI